MDCGEYIHFLMTWCSTLLIDLKILLLLQQHLSHMEFHIFLLPPLHLPLLIVFISLVHLLSKKRRRLHDIDSTCAYVLLVEGLLSLRSFPWYFRPLCNRRRMSF